MTAVQDSGTRETATRSILKMSRDELVAEVKAHPQYRPADVLTAISKANNETLRRNLKAVWKAQARLQAHLRGGSGSPGRRRRYSPTV